MALSGEHQVTASINHWLIFKWSVTSQSKENCASTINWYLNVKTGFAGGFGGEDAPKDWSVTINGQKFSGTHAAHIGASSEATVASGTATIKHNSDGTKSFSYSYTYEFPILGGGTTSGSSTGTLDEIPVKSTLSAASGTLGTALTLTVAKNGATTKHKLKYSCGGSSGYILGSATGYSTDTSVSWTPPIDFAAKNTTGTSVTIDFTLTTHKSDGTTAFTETYSRTYSIPSSVRPSCTISVSDATGAFSEYGFYISGVSKLDITINPTIAYDSQITSYKTTVNTDVYYGSSFTTSVLDSQKSLQNISTTVTDQRGRTGSASKDIVVYAYSAPKITLLKVQRCDKNGKEDDDGQYVKVTYSGEITSISNINAHRWELQYKKTTEDESKYKKVTLNTTDYKVTNGTYIFEADTEFSYDVKLLVSDNFYSADSSYGFKPIAMLTSVSTAFTIMDFGNDGRSVAFGKVAEFKDVLDSGFKIRPAGGYLQPVLEDGVNLNALFTPNTYTLKNAVEANYVSCPEGLLKSASTAVLRIESCGEDGQVRQVITLCNSTTPCEYERFYYINSEGTGMTWYPWKRKTEVVLYNDTTGSNGTITLPETSANFKYIDIFYTDNGGRTGGYTRVYSPNGKIVCLSIVEAAASSYTYIRRTSYTFNGTSLTPDTALAGYARVTGTAVDSSTGSNYIKIKRVVGYE